MHKDVFGQKGDFTTSPEISQMFGEVEAAKRLIALYCLSKVSFNLANDEVPPQGVRELHACKESTGLLALSLQACSSLTPRGGTSLFAGEVGQTFLHRFVRDQTRTRGGLSLAKKHLPDLANS